MESYIISSILQLKTQSIKSIKESYIRINTRELNRVPVIECLSYIYLANSLYYTEPSLP